MIDVESAGLTDVGRKRKANEDSYFLSDDMVLYVVADGMGGHQAGEVASNLVVKTIEDYMSRFFNNGNAESLVQEDKTLSDAANQLNSSIHLANRVVFQLAKEKESYRGMGSTVSAVMFTEDDTIIAANVGDSPIYLIRNNNVETLSVPHTVIAEQMAIDPNAAMHLGRNYRHMLTRAMGIEKNVLSDVCELQCFKDDIIVIASDGLSDKVVPEEIMDIVRKKRPEKSCRMLVDMANDRGGDDNITVIVLKVKAVKRQKSGFLGWISRIFKKD